MDRVSLQSAAWVRIERLGRDLRRRLQPAPSSRTTLFILGCQRSGTTMLMDALGRDPQVKIFGEYSRLNQVNPGLNRFWPRSTRRFDIRLRPLAEVARLVGSVRYPIVVSKPLVESQHAPELLDAVAGSAAVWVFRSFRDVASSNVAKFGAEAAVANLAPVVACDATNWRSELVPADVRELVVRHYRPDMDPYDAGALFWYLRTRLFFDLGLDRDPRVLLLEYETLVEDADRWLAAVYRHAGQRWPGHLIAEQIHTGSVGQAAMVALSPEIVAVCDGLSKRLRDACDEKSRDTSRYR